MKGAATTPSSFRLSPLSFILVGAVFAAAYCQAPLYYSNQNQYFLHGLANAGVGLLSEDWLANTLDPTPVFSALVTGTVRLLHPAAFYLFYALLLGAYAAALLGLFVTLNINPKCQRGDPLAGASGWCANPAARWPVFAA